MTSPRLDMLTAPKRNHYFYGKLLDELHLQMEQDYFNGKRWLLNRLGLGQGVLCGLAVTAEGAAVCISAGVAIDALGREIIVPAKVCLDPWMVAADCAADKKSLARDQPHTVHLVICYQACPSDFAPALVSDCAGTAATEPSTIVERYCLAVRDGAAPDLPKVDPRLCEAINKGASSEEKRANLCALLAASGCHAPEGDVCVVLATIELAADGTVGRVVPCAGRTQIYSNARLFELIACLKAGGGGGRDGVDGKDGANGKDGRDGTNGKDGVDGKNGVDGKDGAPGVGLNPDLTKISGLNWANDQPMPIAAFMKGLQVVFTRPVQAVTANGRAWFLVRVEFPNAAEGTLLEHLVLDTAVQVNPAQRRATFLPHQAFEPNFIQTLTKLGLERAMVRVTLRCAFLLDTSPDKNPVDGDFLGARLPTGDGVAGADFHSWFFLTR